MIKLKGWRGMTCWGEGVGEGQTCCCRNPEEGLSTGHAMSLSQKTQHRIGCLDNSWLALLCQPSQLFVPFWWDMKVEVDRILN